MESPSTAKVPTAATVNANQCKGAGTSSMARPKSTPRNFTVHGSRLHVHAPIDWAGDASLAGQQDFGAMLCCVVW
jgi:hypothetical protein